MRWCISFPNILELRVPVPSDFREVDRLRPTFWVFMDFSDVKYWFWRQFWMLHFRTDLKALKRCKSVCVWVRGMKLYIFLFIILSSVQWKNLFFIKWTPKKMEQVRSFYKFSFLTIFELLFLTRLMTMFINANGLIILFSFCQQY